MTKMDTQGMIALASTVAVLAVVVLALSPPVTIVANEASGDIYGVDILGITKNAGNLPEQQFPAH